MVTKCGDKKFNRVWYTNVYTYVRIYGVARKNNKLQKSLTLGAHAQRGLQQSSRVSVCVCLCVCLSVCYPYSGKPSTKASYQRFQRL